MQVKNHLLLNISQIYIFLLTICDFYMFFTFMLVYVPIFVCLFVHQCMIVQLSLSYDNLNVSL